MTVQYPAAVFQDAVAIAAGTPLRRNRGERAFDLHPAIHVATIAAYLTFIVVLTTAFMGHHLIVPTGIFVIGVAALFVTPALWARVAPDDGAPKQSWREFLQEGVECGTGQLTAGQALAQILVLPGLMVGLALVMALIKASL